MLRRRQHGPAARFIHDGLDGPGAHPAPAGYTTNARSRWRWRFVLAQAVPAPATWQRARGSQDRGYGQGEDDYHVRAGVGGTAHAVVGICGE